MLVVGGNDAVDVVGGKVHSVASLWMLALCTACWVVCASFPIIS